jgi:hypothetical protein
LVRTYIFNQGIGKFNGCIGDWKLKARINLDYFIKLLTLSVSVFSVLVALREDFCVTDAISEVTYEFHIFIFWLVKFAFSLLRLLITGLLLQKARFDARAHHVEFLMNKITLGEVFLGLRRFSPVNIIPSLLFLYS